MSLISIGLIHNLQVEGRLPNSAQLIWRRSYVSSSLFSRETWEKASYRCESGALIDRIFLTRHKPGQVVQLVSVASGTFPGVYSYSTLHLTAPRYSRVALPASRRSMSLILTCQTGADLAAHQQGLRQMANPDIPGSLLGCRCWDRTCCGPGWSSSSAHLIRGRENSTQVKLVVKADMLDLQLWSLWHIL